MCGAANTISNAVKSPTRTLTAIGTGGTSEIYRATVPGAKQGFGAVDRTIDKKMGWGGPGGSSPMVGGTENPAAVLAQTGGAPLLANIAMGADVNGSIASYFGANDYESFFNSLSQDDQKLVDGVRGQLTQIQSNTNLRNQAVQQIVQDFPNIAAQAAKTRQDAGGEFDEATKGAMKLALDQGAAKYAAGGGLSSGAMNEAMAKTGAQYGMDKLSYMDNRGDNAYNQGVQGWQARYNEANALRNFQNTMTQGAAGQGFSAVQASLNRNQQTTMMNAGFANQQSLQSQQNDNAMFGAIGGLAGTVVGGMMGGPPGAMMGGAAGRGLSNGMGGGVTPMSPNQLQFSPQGNGFAGNPRLNLGY